MSQTMMELDPVFIKAIRLLHSRDKNSAQQLRKMVDDVITSRKGKEVKVKVEDDTNKPPEAKRPKLFDVLETLKKESVKDDESKVKKEEKPKPVLLEKTKKKAKPLSDSDSDAAAEMDMDADNFAVDMGIACVVCRQFDVTNSNQLVECQECHNLYHQECHSPKVNDRDLNDPRFVWYCSKCTKLMKKSVTKPPKTKSPLPTNGGGASREKEEKKPPSTSPATTSTTTATSSKSESFTPFRRIEAKSSRSDGASSKPLAGLAGMAANLSGKSEIKPGMRNSEIQKIQKANEAAKKALEMQQQLRDAKIDFSKSSDNKKKSVVIPKAGATKPVASTSQKSGAVDKSAAGPSASAAVADKRLQMMKKKAQAKMDTKKLR